MKKGYGYELFFDQRKKIPSFENFEKSTKNEYFGPIFENSQQVFLRLDFFQNLHIHPWNRCLSCGERKLRFILTVCPPLAFKVLEIDRGNAIDWYSIQLYHSLLSNICQSTSSSVVKCWVHNLKVGGSIPGIDKCFLHIFTTFFYRNINFEKKTLCHDLEFSFVPTVPQGKKLNSRSWHKVFFSKLIFL